MRPWTKLVLLGALYASQGLPFGFFTEALPVVMRQAGWSREAIGGASVLGLPWLLKPLWAPIVERVGVPRGWLLGLQATTVVVLLAMGAVDPTAQVAWLVAAVAAVNLAASTQDVVTDGLAVDLLGADERGWGNGIQYAGYRAGQLVGGGALLLVADRIGWAATTATLAGFLVLCTLPVLALPTVGTVRFGRPTVRLPWDWLLLPAAQRWVVVLVAFKLGDYLVQGMVRVWLVDAGFDKADLGWLYGTLGVGAAIAGALVGGALVRPLGHARALVVFGLAQSAMLGAYAALAASGSTGTPLVGVVVVEHLVSGMLTASLFTSMMDASRPGRGAVDFTLQASIVVLGQLAGSGLSGLLAARLDYDGAFAVGALLSLAGPALLAWPAMRAAWALSGGEPPVRLGSGR